MESTRLPLRSTGWPAPARPSPWRRAAVVVGRLALTGTLALSCLWAVLALWYQLPLAETGRQVAGGLWALATLVAVALVWRGHAGRAMAGWGLAFAALLGWWAQIEPSDTRDWASDVARHLTADVKGHHVTLHQVRNFDWQREGAPVVRWETRRYDLDQLDSVDLALSYWMGPAIAHTLVSFGFVDAAGKTDYVAFSVEIRKERDETFSAIAGFFKRFELALVAADERDVLRVRTNVRDEDVHLYRIALPPEAARSLFLAYVDQARELSARPRFYDTLTANCTTIVYQMAQRIVGGLPLDWRLLASGYLPEYLAKIDGFSAKQDLATLQSAGRITARALAAHADPRFSDRIRQGVPGTGLRAGRDLRADAPASPDSGPRLQR